MYIADPGKEYRFIWCRHCRSIRFHSLIRREIRKFGPEWWVRCTIHCFGLAPIVLNRIRRLDLLCEQEEDRWMPAVEWNALIKQDSYAA